jgi:hypothetical protein
VQLDSNLIQHHKRLKNAATSPTIIPAVIRGRSPGYYGHRNYGKSGSISWHPKSPIFCHGNPVVCHPSTPITPVTPISSHPGGPNGAIISHPIIPVGRIGSGSAGGGNITPVTPVISHPGEGIVGAGSPISPSSPGDPGGGGFPGGPVGIPSF